MIFTKILVANRGEIACRIINTLHKLNIDSVAVYSDPDAGAKHTKLATEAYHIGPANSQLSYLQGDKLIKLAKQVGAQAIHPGYGFLSENAEFARNCEQAGITFIGPSSDVIEIMGSKSAAKQTMQNAGVPLIPGYHGKVQTPEVLLAEAIKIGFPVLIKPSAGGGGKGMMIVESRDQFITALEASKRVAKSSFGDDTILLEKYLSNPKHIEVQVFGDQHNNYVHLFERNCSLQRRQQKIIEEAPSGLSSEIQQKICNAAVTAARNIKYLGAGTVEFLFDGEQFYFMEMNTRLQVEHPVTEQITGFDLVEWQIKIAAGEPIPYKQDQISYSGHSIEARIYAENPEHDFLPASGIISHLSFPKDIRFDSGVDTGSNVTLFYDPMLAKLIVHAPSRDQAIAKLTESLAKTHILGFTTNLQFLRNLSAHSSFLNNSYSTNFVDHNLTSIIKTKIDSSFKDSGWRMNASNAQPKALQAAEKLYQLKYNSMAENVSKGDLVAPMPGIISKILTSIDSKVTANEPLLILEAMKMEHTIVAPHAGIVTNLEFSAGDSVELGSILLKLEEIAE